MADGDTVAEKIADIAASKAAIAQAISAKGVAVPSGAKLADLATLVGQITGGGGAQDTCALDRQAISELSIPEGVERVGNYAFYNCGKLASLTLPSGLLEIGQYAFFYCQRLASLTIPSSVTSIEDRAFSTCRALTSLVIPSGVTRIGGNAFYECSSLASLTIPEGVIYIGTMAFSGCPATCDITFAKPMAEVSAMGNYPWGISSGAVIHCTDGDLTV